MADTKTSLLPEVTSLVETDLVPVVTNMTAVPQTSRITWANILATITASIHAAASKATPVDADEVPLLNSASSFAKNRLTWGNIKATLKTYFDAIYAPLASPTFTGDVAVGGAVKAGTYLKMGVQNATIASDAITVTGGYVVLDTEGAAATDNLATINGGETGQLLVLRTTNASRDVTVKDAGTLYLAGGDMVLDTNQDTLTLLCIGANTWVELARANNA